MTQTARKKDQKKKAGLRDEFKIIASGDNYEIRDQTVAMSYPQRTPVVPAELEGGNGQRMPMDIYSYELLNKRLIRLTGPIDDMVAERVIAALEFLDEVDPEHKDIELRINSPGGVVTSGMAIYDKIQSLKSDVKTVVEGQAASMGAVLLAAGAHGKRLAMPNARIMIHQPLGGAQGQATDIQIQAKEIQRMKELLTQILADHSGTDYETLVNDMERDNFLSPEEAKRIGLIDDVVYPERKPRFSQSNDNTPKEVKAKRKSAIKVKSPKVL